MKSSKLSHSVKSRILKKSKLYDVYRALLKAFDDRGWWPGETPFEVMVGAILTQNTNWKNVESAISQLKAAGLLTPQSLHAASRNKIARLIRPAGYFNVKADRLKHFMDFFYREYSGDSKLMSRERGDVLRKKLLAVKGIGPETADSILVYAAYKPFFVIDAYTKRIFSRHKLFSSDADYDAWQRVFMEAIPKKVKLYNDFHAQIVELGKRHCRTIPQCQGCPLEVFL